MLERIENLLQLQERIKYETCITKITHPSLLYSQKMRENLSLEFANTVQTDQCPLLLAFLKYHI